MAVLVTGAAGFIGAATSHALLDRGDEVVGIDNLNDYYDPKLKRARLTSLQQQFGNRFRFDRVDFADAVALKTFADTIDIDAIVVLITTLGASLFLLNLPGVIREIDQVRIAKPQRIVEEDAELATAFAPTEPAKSSPWD